MLDAAPDLPSVIYNSPHYGFETRADLFFQLRADHPNLVGYKEFGGRQSLSYAAEHITSGSPDLDLLVGVDTQVVHGIVHCGAVGVITGIGNVLPDAVLTSIRLARAAAGGDPTALRLALELEQRPRSALRRSTRAPTSCSSTSISPCSPATPSTSITSTRRTR